MLGAEQHGRGETLVIALHSWMSTHTSFKALRPYLDGDTYTFLLADHRGYGLSHGLAGPFHIEQAVADVLGLAHEAGHDRFHVVGHSMSGMVVQRMTIDVPERLLSATLVTPVPANGMPLDDEGRKMFEAATHDDDAWAGIATMMTGEALGPHWAKALLPSFRATVDPVAMRGFLDMWTGQGFEAQMPGRTTPTHVITGDRDIPALRAEVLQPVFENWFNQMSMTQLDTGHFPMLEAPPRFAWALQNFLGGLTC